MPQRIHNLSKWVLVNEGNSLRFDNPKQRNVELDVNCPDEVRFYVLEDLADREEDPERISDLEAGREVDPIVVDAGPLKKLKSLADAPVSDRRAVTFLGIAKGRDRFEFTVAGAFDLVVVGGAAYVYTIDSAELGTNIVAPVIFTRIANRRQRNPQLEMMEYQMRLNSERMYAALEQESLRRHQALERRLEAYAPERNQGTPLAPTRQQQPAAGDRGPTPDARSGEAGADADQSGDRRAPAARGAAAGPADDKGKAKPAT